MNSNNYIYSCNNSIRFDNSFYLISNAVNKGNSLPSVDAEKRLDFREYNDTFQWKYTYENNWHYLLPKQVIKSYEGVTTLSPMMQNNSQYIQWKASNEPGWHNLIALDSLKGSNGQNGRDGKDGISRGIYYTLGTLLPMDETGDIETYFNFNDPQYNSNPSLILPDGNLMGLAVPYHYLASINYSITLLDSDLPYTFESRLDVPGTDQVITTLSSSNTAVPPLSLISLNAAVMVPGAKSQYRLSLYGTNIANVQYNISFLVVD